jgi:hypothetical protein
MTIQSDEETTQSIVKSIQDTNDRLIAKLKQCQEKISSMVSAGEISEDNQQAYLLVLEETLDIFQHLEEDGVL